MALSDALPWEMDVVGGIQRLEADLRTVDVRRFELTGGSERVQIELGQPVGEVGIRVTGGANHIRLERPARVPVRLRIRGGVNHVEVDGQQLGAKGGEISIDTRDDGSPAGRYVLELSGGSRSIEVVARPE
jgi:hypothetical protein